MRCHVVILEEYDKHENIDRVIVSVVTTSFDKAISVFNSNVEYAESIARKNGYETIEKNECFFCAYSKDKYDEGRICTYIEETKLVE